MASIRSGIGEFQSTLPREERLFHNCFEHVFNYFNPRSHERSDGQSGHVYQKNHQISIHAPTRGATVTTIFVMTDAQFQSTLPREERLFFCSHFPIIQHFNPRSHERSDQLPVLHTCHYNYFNPRSHERSDSNIAQKICLFLYNTDNKYIIR